MKSQPAFYLPVTVHNDSASYAVSVPFVESLPEVQSSSNQSVIILQRDIGAFLQGLYVFDGTAWRYTMAQSDVTATMAAGNSIDLYANRSLTVTTPNGTIMYKGGQVQVGNTIAPNTGIYAVRTQSLAQGGQQFDKGYGMPVPLTGGTVNIPAGQTTTILNPAGTLATLTVNLPFPVGDGAIAKVTSSQTVTALTVASPGATVNTPPTTIAPGAGHAWIYNAANLTWWRLY